MLLEERPGVQGGVEGWGWGVAGWEAGLLGSALGLQLEIRVQGLTGARQEHR